jgi:PTS system galactitol-specific IIA component
MKALGNLLVKSAILINYPAKDAEDIVSALGGCLLKAGFVKDTFVEAALTREKTMPTGLPLNGSINAAIPHTDVEHVLKAGVAMATLTDPIQFQNMAQPDDSVDVRLVFLLALDKPKAQIEMLQEIAGILQNSTLIESIMRASDAESILEIIQNGTE